ncbi:unnamed protein product [Ostreobium quekettii]|uniref:Uncharacterized protein n=1 Tax=Ostreobium quekettii TaxID=121088 RepID=A0A8S1J218_9CHLO|nr:unnamed protein product [Ostreobium quekettii]
MEKDVDVCLIVKDKDDKERKAFKELLVPGSVAKVLGAKKMLKKYESYEARRQLVKRYDLFLMDKRMVTVTTDYIGKEFTRRKKCPAFVDIAKKNPVNSIQRMRQSTFMYQWGGSSRSARVAWSSFSPSQIVDNIFMALYDFVRHLQGGWEDILSVFLKTQDSTSLPIYQSMPGMLGNLEVVQEGECAASSSDDIAEEFEDSKSKKAAEKVEMIGRGKRKNTQKEGHKKKAKGRTAKATLR